MSFEHKKLLIGHIAAKHNQELMPKCRFCTRKFSRVDVRDSHEREMHKDGNTEPHFKCAECDEGFDLREDLMNHRIRIHYSGPIHTCEECGKIFKKKSVMEMHSASHKKKTIQCDVCKMMFTFKTGLAKHKKCGRCKGPPKMALMVALGKEEIARIAKEQFDEITVNPVKKREEDVFEDFSDEIFDEMAKKPKIARMAKPMDIKQEDSRHSPVVVITTLKSSSGRLIRPKLPHILSPSTARPINIHKKANVPFECDQCGRMCASKSDLSLHLNQHLRGKKHPCQSCDTTFCNLAGLKKHYALVHPVENYFKEKRFQCDGKKIN